MQDTIKKCLGLVTQYNPLTMAPGALKVANNCLIRRENIIEDRRGHRKYSDFANNVNQFLTYQNRVLVHQGSIISYDNGSGTFADYAGTYDPISGTKIRFIEAFSNLFATTSLGVKIFSDITGTTARLAGVPRALDPSYTLTGSSGFLSNNFQCAYRCALQRTDAQSNVITGYPSQRLWVINAAGGARNVVLTAYLPTEAKLGDVIQFYRTTQQSGTTVDSSADEMGLVYQYELISTDVSNGFVTFTDSVTDDLRGATLYTSPSQEGIGQANERPPLSKDLTLYKSNYMLYANTKTKQRLFFTMVGAGSLSSKTITLAGVTYNFGSSEIISGGGSPQILVSSTGVAAADIDLTARSLVRVINRYAGNTTVYAYYLTGPADLPGQIMIEEKGVGGAQFTLQSSDSAISGMFFPAAPISPATSTKSTSSNQVEKNMVYYSKSQQLEHVPLLNKLPVGPANKEILRIVALRDSAIVIKEEGVYRITGETPQSFTVVPVDLTTFCKSANSVSVLANQVFMLSNQGVVSISESGVQVVSRDIEPNLTPLLTVSALKDYTAGVAYDSERSYFLSTITQTNDTVPNQTFVYNVFTKTWVRHTYAFVAAVIENGADKMYFAKPSISSVFQERKSFDDTDFADPELAITINSISGRNINFSVSGVSPLAGWVISKGTSDIAITSLTQIIGSYNVVVASDPPADWTTGAATLFPSVGFEIEWHSWTYSHPEILKQVHDVGIFADDIPGNNTVSSLVTTFRSNFDQEQEGVTIIQPGVGWGAAWGNTPWGGSGDSSGYPSWVPRNKQYCTRLTLGVKHLNAHERISIAGCGFNFETSSDRIGR